MKKYTQEELNNILSLHKKWLQGNPEGIRANLYGVDFSGTDFSGADLTKANFFDADFTGANFTRTNFTSTNLTRANFSEANFTGADLSGANCSKTNFSDANFYKANFFGANLTEVNCFGANFSGVNLFEVKFDDILLIIAHPMYEIQIKGKKWIKVGCKEHSYEKWLSFTNEEIKDMADNALEFYPILVKYLKAAFE
jgi:hypothetical protein